MCTRITIGLMSFCGFIYSNVGLVKVIDGDTIKVNIEGTITNVRMLGIDAPERSTLRYGYAEKGGENASRYLYNILKKKSITLKCKDYKDKYNRELCVVFGNGKNINKMMLNAGYAKKF